MSSGDTRVKQTFLRFTLLALAIPPVIDLLRGEVRPLRWLVAYLVFAFAGIVTYVTWTLWPSRLLLRASAGAIVGVVTVTLIFLLVTVFGN